MKKKFYTPLIVLLLLIPAMNVQAGPNSLLMATTTSTDGTGLLDYLKPFFEKDTKVELKWMATGTGKALKLGQNCDVDVLLVHAPPSEMKYIKAGYGKDRREIMYNDFVIIGPSDDPAGIKGKSVSEALAAIKSQQALFLSRGDDSGTNKKERLLWKNASIDLPDKESWYIQTGQGMGTTITMTQEKNGYTMADRGSFIKYQSQNGGSNSPLNVLVEGDAILLNQYSVLTLEPKNCPQANYELAKKFSDWMASPRAQKLIKDFKLLGQPLFVPNAQ
jgi:tungstate transport system substrate-binding protein